MLHKALVLSALLLVVGVVAAACGDDDDDSPQDAETNVCSSLDDLATAIQGVQALTADSTVDEAQDAVDALKSAWQDVLSTGANLEQTREDELDEAIAGVQDSVESVSGNDTIADSLTDIQSSVESAAAARAAIGSGLDCP